MSDRAMASATISFGLVTVPVKVYAATSSEALSFNMITPGGNRVKQKLVDSVSGEEVERDQCLKGYEYAKDQFVTFSKEELAKLDSENTKMMEIQEFVDADSVNPLFIEKVYYLGPDKGGDRGYSLLAQTMSSLKKVAVAQWTNRGRDHLVLIAPFRSGVGKSTTVAPHLEAGDQDGLCLFQCFYKDEVRDFEVDVAKLAPMSKPEEVVAKKLVSMLSTGGFDPSKYHDRYAKRVKEAVDQKVAGQEVTVPAEAPKTNVLDLYEALKASIHVAETKKK